MYWYHLFPFVAFSAAFIALVIIAYTWQFRSRPIARFYMLFMASVSWWCFSAGMRALARSTDEAFIWHNAMFLGVSFAPVLFTIFILHYLGYEQWTKGQWLKLLFVIPTITQVAAWTNPYYNLFYEEITYAISDGNMIIAQWASGPWFIVHSTYSYGLTLLVLLLGLMELFRLQGLYRRQGAILLLCIIPPLVASIIWTFNLIPSLKQPITPVGFLFSCLILAYDLYHFHLVDILPVARYKLVDFMLDGVMVFDQKNRIIDLNQAMAKILQVKPADVIGKPIEGVKWKSDLLQNALKSEQVGGNKVLGNHNDTQFFDFKFSKLSTSDGNNMKLIEVRDMTPLKIAEEALKKYNEELKESNAELDAFAHTVAHDLKSPLNNIIGLTHILQGMADQKNVKCDELTLLSNTADKMRRIIHELLLLAQVRKAEDLRFEQVDMLEVIRSVMERLQPMIYQYRGEIVFSDHWPKITSYFPWLEEVWANYLSNALKYGGIPPKVELGFEKLNNSRYKFWVKDNGNGISEEDKPRLFQKFVRLSKIKVEGHGLGLSIVQRIISKLGGEVGVDCSEGTGSTFYFILHE